MTERTISGDERAAALQGLMARAATDRAFRERLLGSPAETLREADFTPPHGVEFRAVDPVPGSSYIILPEAPGEGEVSDADLVEASGGSPTIVVATIYGSLMAVSVGSVASIHAAVLP